MPRQIVAKEPGFSICLQHIQHYFSKFNPLAKISSTQDIIIQYFVATNSIKNESIFIN